MSDKKFVGNCKKVQTWGTKIGLHKDSVVFDERGWFNIVVVHNSDKDDKKPYAYIDEWRPTQQAEESATMPQKSDGLPF